MSCPRLPRTYLSVAYATAGRHSSRRSRQRGGARGYRAAQLEGGVAAERLQLAAFALGVGATGLTFLDDDVSAFFGTRAAPMLSVAVGVPAYRARPGMRPAQLPRVGLAER